MARLRFVSYCKEITPDPIPIQPFFILKLFWEDNTEIIKVPKTSMIGEIYPENITTML